MQVFGSRSGLLAKTRPAAAVAVAVSRPSMFCSIYDARGCQCMQAAGPYGCGCGAGSACFCGPQAIQRDLCLLAVVPSRLPYASLSLCTTQSTALARVRRGRGGQAQDAQGERDGGAWRAAVRRWCAPLWQRRPDCSGARMQQQDAQQPGRRCGMMLWRCSRRAQHTAHGSSSSNSNSSSSGVDAAVVAEAAAAAGGFVALLPPLLSLTRALPSINTHVTGRPPPSASRSPAAARSWRATAASST